MSINLTKERFITVKYVDGHSDVLNFPDVLKQSHMIKCLDYKYPVKTEMFALYRFLTQVACDIFCPSSPEDIYDIFDGGCFNSTDIDAYFENYYNRFDLFDKDHPFMQVPKKYFHKKTEPVNIKTLSPLLREGHNDIFYRPEYTHLVEEQSWTIEHTVGSLLFWAMNHLQTGSGNKASVLGDSGNTPLYTLYEGENLFMTIIFGMRPVRTNADIPYWRRDVYPETPEQLPDFNSLMSYEFYPVMKLLLDETGYKDGTFSLIYKESDENNPIYKTDNMLNVIKMKIRALHPAIRTFTKKGKDSNETFIEKADTTRKYWLDIGTSAINRAVTCAESQYEHVIAQMRDDDVAPKYLNISYFGVYAGKNSNQYCNIYAAFPDLPWDVLCDSEHQKETEKLVEYINSCGKALSETSDNYVKYKEPDRINTEISEYKNVNSRFFRAVKILFLDEYIKDMTPDIDAYIANIWRICCNTFTQLSTIRNDEITKLKYNKHLIGKLKKIKEKIYGTAEDSKPEKAG